MMSRLITPALIADFRSKPLVVLSPHFDDACFSLGCFLAAVGQGTLINIFTRSIHIPGHRATGGITIDPEYGHKVRDAEDLEFARRCGLERRDLRAEEPPVLGRHFRDPSGLAYDVEQISQTLIATLDDIASGWGAGVRGQLFAPLGIGIHVNHMAVSKVVADNQKRLGVSYDLFFYEDIPYAHNPLRRRDGLVRARADLNLGLQTRYVLAVPWREKKALINLYPSQLNSQPFFAKYRPATLTPLAVYEAFWAAEPR
jgi:hypothetical protein